MEERNCPKCLKSDVKKQGDPCCKCLRNPFYRDNFQGPKKNTIDHSCQNCSDTVNGKLEDLCNECIRNPFYRDNFEPQD